MLISLIVPCFNEESTLPLFYREIKKVLSSMDCRHELLLIDDGSADGTLDVMRRLSAEDTCIRYYSLSRNFGKESAMYAGFFHAAGDYVAVMDADMQDPPSLLPHMLELLRSGNYDSVATRRVSRASEPALRSRCAVLFYRLFNRVSTAPIMDGARDFRLMKREMVQVLLHMCESNRFSKGMYGWIGFRTCWLPFENVPRSAGRSKWSFFKLFGYALEGLTDFTFAPLRLPTLLGLALLLSALIVLFTGSGLISVILAGFGLQLLCTGILARYLAKIFVESKGRPHCVISESNDQNVHPIL